MILLLDNYDSFTWNLVQAFQMCGADVAVQRNDALTVDEALALGAQAVVLSPGPGRPEVAGIQPELIARLPAPVPLLGVCLGHQGLVQAHGGEIERDPEPVHGRATRVLHDGSRLFAGMESPFEAGRYHSLRGRRASMPSALAITAWTEDGVVMAVAHKTLPRFGVQFHPESILTPEGTRLVRNFLEIASAA